MQPSSSNRLENVFRKAADEASASLSKWLGRPTRITVKEVAAIPLDEAVVMLGSGDAILCVCAMHIRGDMPGILALAVSDESGLALADLLMGRPAGTSTEWGDIERSAAAETTNIIGCAYLNAMASEGGAGAAPSLLMPSPPWFVRDYPEAVMGSIVMTQETAADGIFLTRTVFDIEDTTIRCSLVFVPQAVAADDDPALGGRST
jgi:chemotaxis protein CheC